MRPVCKCFPCIEDTLLLPRESVWGFGFRIGLGFRVSGFGSRVLPPSSWSLSAHRKTHCMFRHAIVSPLFQTLSQCRRPIPTETHPCATYTQNTKWVPLRRVRLRIETLSLCIIVTKYLYMCGTAFLYSRDKIRNPTPSRTHHRFWALTVTQSLTSATVTSATSAAYVLTSATITRVTSAA